MPPGHGTSRLTPGHHCLATHCLATEFLYRQRARASERDEADEQPGCHQHVVCGPMRRVSAGKPISKVELFGQGAKPVTGLSGQQAPSELERVEHFGALPVAELALKHIDVDMSVVGDDGRAIKGPKYLAFDLCEHRRVSDVLVPDAVNLAGPSGVIGVSGRTSQLTGSPMTPSAIGTVASSTRSGGCRPLPSTSTTTYRRLVQSAIARCVLPSDVGLPVARRRVYFPAGHYQG